MAKIELNPTLCSLETDNQDGFRILSHTSFLSTYEILKKRLQRFQTLRDDRIYNEMMLLFLAASKKYLEHRGPAHLSRLILSIHCLQKSLQTATIAHPTKRHLLIRWIPTRLSFPFTSKLVLGCLVGFNVIDRYELFDEENILLVLRKNHPNVRLVKDSSYTHFIPDSNLKVLYFEIERTDGSLLSLAERQGLTNTLKRQIMGGFEKVAPTVFMRRNEEEVHKTILTLSREINSLQDIPQAWITFERQLGDEIIFVVVLVYVSPKRHFPLHQQFSLETDCTFVSERIVTVRHLLKHPIEAHVFRLHLNRSLEFIRSDGSLDFYASRQKVVALINAAIGEFRDYNGGGIIKQRELLDDLKGRFPWVAQNEPELLETFFYEITPLEQQTLIPKDLLTTLFEQFLSSYERKLPADLPYILRVSNNEKGTFIAVQTHHASWKQAILNVVEQSEYNECGLIYTVLDIPEGLFFHCVLPQNKLNKRLVEALRKTLEEQHQLIARHQVLRIGMEYGLVSLDPRVGGDLLSKEALRLLFEGLTRVDESGQVRHGIAEAIEISPDQTQYTFKLRPAQWNDGLPVKASDFEYAWKKILSPMAKSSFAYCFYPIKNAKACTEGKVSLDQVGIRSIDERTLVVDLAHPAPYFLEFTAQSIYYPVHQLIDQHHPQWPHQVGHNYPCNGPFQLVVNNPNLQTYRFSKNPSYWDAGSIVLDEIILTQTDPHQALTLFQSGQLDWIGNPFGNWHTLYQTQNEGRQISHTHATSCWLVLNTRASPLNHPKIRQALALAVNREALIDQAHTLVTPSYSLLPPHNHPQACFPHQDIEQAQQMLMEGLAELGISKSKIPVLELMHHPGGIREKMALRLALQLHDNLGLECHVKPMHWTSIFSKMTQGTFQMSLVQWYPLANDPIIALNSFKHAQDSMNMSGWEHPDFQRWLELSDHEINPSQRAQYLRQAEEYLAKEAPVVPLVYEPSQALVKCSLHVTHSQSFDLARSYFNPTSTNKKR